MLCIKTEKGTPTAGLCEVCLDATDRTNDNFKVIEKVFLSVI